MAGERPAAETHVRPAGAPDDRHRRGRRRCGHALVVGARLLLPAHLGDARRRRARARGGAAALSYSVRAYSRRTRPGWKPADRYSAIRWSPTPHTRTDAAPRSTLR